MPTNLTDVSTFDTVIGPSPTDIRNAAAVRSYLQTLANRTKFLSDRLTALADITALKAIASPADGLVRFVKSKGIYLFDSASVAAESQPFIVQPDSGTGRWLHELLLVQGQANGLASLDSNTKVKPDQVPNRLVSAQTVKLTGNQSTSSSTIADVTGLSIALTGVVGDILQVDASLDVIFTGTGFGLADIVVVDGGVTQEFGAARESSDTTVNSMALSSLYVVQNAGAVTVKVRYRTTGTNFRIGGSASASSAQSSLRVLQFRP